MKVAIISSNLVGLNEQTEIGYETRQIKLSIENLGGEVLLIDPAKISYGVEGNIAFARFKGLDGKIWNIEEVNALMIRRTRGLIEQIMDFAEFAERASPSLVVVDPIASFGRPTSKVDSILQRAAKFPQPDTQVASEVDALHPNTVFPVIAKPTHGAAGRNVKKCDSIEDLRRYLADIPNDGAFGGYGTLVQQALPIDIEFRVMVVGGVGLGCVEKKLIEGKPDVRNASQGGTFVNYDGINRDDVINFAENLSRYLGQDISGVDLIQSNSRLHVIECNRNPQFQEFDFATQSKTSDAIANLIQQKIRESSGDQIQTPDSVEHVTRVSPRIFIGCSTEGLRVAEEVQHGLSRSAQAVLWNQGTFRAGENSLQSLNNALHKFDYAVFCLTGDDMTDMRGKSALEPRDNVIFEAGLFMGKLGLDRVFLVVNRKDWPKLPSDLSGLTVITWEKYEDFDIRPAVASAVLEIKRLLRLH